MSREYWLDLVAGLGVSKEESIEKQALPTEYREAIHIPEGTYTCCAFAHSRDKYIFCLESEKAWPEKDLPNIPGSIVGALIPVYSKNLSESVQALGGATFLQGLGKTVLCVFGEVIPNNDRKAYLCLQ